MANTYVLSELLNTLPQRGSVVWIGVRPERIEQMKILDKVEALTDKGLVGDHYSGGKESKRQITLIQQEHINTVKSYLDDVQVDPMLIRRNIVVKGINLLALKDKQFYVGEVLLEYTGECHPCSRMEQNLGPGGYNAMRGHGGITARILAGGIIKLNDQVFIQPTHRN